MSEQKLQEILNRMEIENAKLVQMNKEVFQFEIPVKSLIICIWRHNTGRDHYCEHDMKNANCLNFRLHSWRIPP